jgi:hypothetical protein
LDRISERKLRLFACACARGVEDSITHEASRHLLEAGEQFADGRTTQERLNAAYLAAMQPGPGSSDVGRAALAAGGFSPEWARQWGHDQADVRQALFGRAHTASNEAAWVVARRTDDEGIRRAFAEARVGLTSASWDVLRDRALEVGRGTVWGKAYAAAERGHCALLRDIAGNPFRPSSMNPTWLAWNSGIVVRLAESIYEERTFDRMPILGDALEEAGGGDAAILDHCRQPGVHTRGCWVVDGILGRT